MWVKTGDRVLVRNEKEATIVSVSYVSVAVRYDDGTTEDTVLKIEIDVIE